MKKLGLFVKEVSANRIKTNVEKAQSMFIVKYSGLSSPDICALRQSLKTVQATLFVVRNNVAKRTLKELGYEQLLGSVEGPCGFVFTESEPVGVSKIICDFSKDHEHLKIEAGLLYKKNINKKDIEALAKLPSKEVLRAQVVMGLKSPINGIVMVLSHTLKKFVYCLDQIKNKKQV